MTVPIIQAKDLLKTDGIFKARPDESLSSALKNLTHTHDAIFVFDAQDKFLGVINPHYTVYKSSYPPETKLVNCLHKPPLLTADTFVWDIARLMLESKVYYLPVFEKNTFIGIVTINRVLQAVRSMQNGRKIAISMKKKVITIDQDATVEDAYTSMRDQHVSRLPVVNEHGHLVGVITRYDVQKLFSEPKQKPRFLSRIGEKERLLDHPLKMHFQKVVVQASPDTDLDTIIDSMEKETVGSVIIVDKNRKPVGIVSTHDVLKAVEALRPQPDTKLELHLSPDFIHETQLIELVNGFEEKIEKSYPLNRIRLNLKTDKNAAGKVSRYEVMVQIEFASRRSSVISRAEGHLWRKAVRDALSKAKAQLYD